jgi:integrase
MTIEELHFIYMDARDRIPQKRLANHATAARTVARSRLILKRVGIPETAPAKDFGKKFNGLPLPKHYVYGGGAKEANDVRMARLLFTRTMIDYYEERGIDVEPFNCWSRIRLETPTVRRFTPEEGLEERVVAACEALKGVDDEFYKAYLLAYGFGLRASEVARAVYGDLYERNGGCIIRVWKPKSIQGASSEDFQERPVQREWFERVMAFKTAEEDRIINCSKKRFERKFPKFLRDAGITDGRPVHYLRKFCGDRVLRGNDVWAAQMALGHSSIDVTSKIYVQIPNIN